MENCKERIQKKLDSARKIPDSGKPVMSNGKTTYEFSEKVKGIGQGGIGVINNMVKELKLAEAIDKNLSLLKIHRPYYESDHVMNLAYNILCGGKVLQDIELRRNDESYLNVLGVEAIPDPTTAGDFCRRFEESDIESFQDAINGKRIEVWKTQDKSFFEEANIDMDGVIVPTSGECKEGMDMSYKGTWGYHPLLFSLANTGEPLFIENRSGNAASHQNAAYWSDKSIKLCLEAGFKKIRLRGDSAFSLTENFDTWTKKGINFVFSYDSMENLKESVELFDESDWSDLVRKADIAFQRERPENVKEKMVVIRGFKDMKLKSEDILELQYTPTKCSIPYRMIAIRKEIETSQYGQALFKDHRYFFYVTNDEDLNMYEVVKHANERCNQENLNEQLQNGTRSLRAPLDSLLSNWAWMEMTSLAWTLKAWMALLLPIDPNKKEEHTKEAQELLRMEFRTFVNYLINIPAQVINSGRRKILRLISWNPKAHILIRFSLTFE